MNKTATVISLTDRISTTDTVTSLPERPDSGPISVSYLGNSQRERTRSRRPLKSSRLDEAFAAICATLSEDLRDVERSNSFDEWKEALEQEASIVIEGSLARRQILGILLAATRQKDISDFTPASLRAFRAITNTLRRPKAALLDVKTVIAYLKNAEVAALLPLEVGNISETEEAKLDRFLDDLVAQHS